MPYATVDHIRHAISPDEFHNLTDQNHDGTLDMARVEQALDDASAVADSYIAAFLPLASTPSALRVAVVDIAIYRLASTEPSSDQELRFKAAMKWLSDASVGKVRLAASTGATPSRSSSAILVSVPRQSFFGGDGNPHLP